MAKHPLKAQILEGQEPVLLEENSAYSLSLAYSSSSKLFSEVNADLLEVSCAQIQSPAHSSKSIFHHPHSTQFKIRLRYITLGAKGVSI